MCLPLHAKEVDETRLLEGLQHRLQLFVGPVDVADDQFEPVAGQVAQANLLVDVDKVAHVNLSYVAGSAFVVTRTSPAV